MEEEVNNKTYLIFIVLIAAHIIYKTNKSIFNKTKTSTFLYLIDYHVQTIQPIPGGVHGLFQQREKKHTFRGTSLIVLQQRICGVTVVMI